MAYAEKRGEEDDKRGYEDSIGRHEASYVHYDNISAHRSIPYAIGDMKLTDVWDRRVVKRHNMKRCFKTALILGVMMLLMLTIVTLVAAEEKVNDTNTTTNTTMNDTANGGDIVINETDNSSAAVDENATAEATVEAPVTESPSTTAAELQDQTIGNDSTDNTTYVDQKEVNIIPEGEERDKVRAQYLKKILDERAAQEPATPEQDAELMRKLALRKVERKPLIEENKEVGISPESALYPLDRLSKKVVLALTRKGYQRAIASLEILDERLIELKKAAEEKDFSAMREAKDSYESAALDFQQNLDQVEEDDAVLELREVLELQYQLDSHELVFRQVSLNQQRILKDALSDTEYEKYTGMFTIVSLSIRESQLKLRTKEESTRIKLRLTQQLKDDQIDRLSIEIEQLIQDEDSKERPLSFNIGMAEKEIERAETSLQERLLLEKDATLMQQNIDDAMMFIKKAKVAYAMDSTNKEEIMLYTSEAHKKAAQARLGGAAS